MTIDEARKNLFAKTPVDTIISTYIQRNYIEFLVICGGDLCTYRVYHDGTILEI